jgi:hypothetical protein
MDVCIVCVCVCLCEIMLSGVTVDGKVFHK